MSYLKTVVVGFLGSDCRVSNINGRDVINFSIAHGEKFKDAQGVQRERTLWISASYWPERTTIAQYLKKGTMVLLEGKPDVGIYQDKQGKWQAEFKLRVGQIQLLGGSKESNGSSGTQNNNTGYSQPMTQSQYQDGSDVTEAQDGLPF